MPIPRDPRPTVGSGLGHGLIAERDQVFLKPGAEKDFGLGAVSRRRKGDQFTFPIGCECKAGKNVITGEVRKVRKNFVF